MTYYVVRNVTTGRASKAFMSLDEAYDAVPELCAVGDEFTISRQQSWPGEAEIVERGIFGS
jgi:hypothetical protein